MGVSFGKNNIKGKGSLKNRRKGRGLWANMPFFFLLTRRTKEGEAQGASGGPRRRPRAQRRPGPGEKREEATRSRFPSPISEEGTRREGCDGPGHGGRAAAMGSASKGGQGWVRAGKREREAPSTYLGPWLEQGGGGAGRPREAGAAGGAGSRWRRCCSEEEGARRWRWLWSWGSGAGASL